MSDIEAARQRVIDAARAMTNDAHENAAELVDALDALDAAERPCPWAILRELELENMNTAGGCIPVFHAAQIRRALQWHYKQKEQA